MLERTLKELFDFQRFERNADLQPIIDGVQAKYFGGEMISLADDELDMAAGGLGMPDETKITQKKEPSHDGFGLL